MAVEQKYKTKHSVAAKKSIPVRIGQVFAFIGVFILIIAVTLFIMLKVICSYGASKNTFVTTVLESGQMKFLASLCLSESEIKEIINGTSLEQVGETNVNEGMISLPNQGGENPSGTDMSKIEVVEIAGLTYKATMMIIQDPSRVSVASVATGPSGPRRAFR